MNILKGEVIKLEQDGHGKLWSTIKTENSIVSILDKGFKIGDIIEIHEPEQNGYPQPILKIIVNGEVAFEQTLEDGKRKMREEQEQRDTEAMDIVDEFNKNNPNEMQKNINKIDKLIKIQTNLSVLSNRLFKLEDIAKDLKDINQTKVLADYLSTLEFAYVIGESALESIEKCVRERITELISNKIDKLQNELETYIKEKASQL